MLHKPLHLSPTPKNENPGVNVIVLGIVAIVMVAITVVAIVALQGGIKAEARFWEGWFVSVEAESSKSSTDTPKP